MDIPYPSIKILGEGAYGITHLVNYNGEEAVLKWPKENNKEDKEEAETMKRLHCRYCVHIIDEVTKDGKTGILMEYCSNKTLKDVLDKFKQKNKMLSKRGILKLFCEIMLGLKYLHDHKVLHLDLKPANIFITEDNMCVLGDFGLSVVFDDVIQDLDKYRGTYVYSSPEQLCNTYNSPADIYSLGLILYEICTLERFFGNAKSVKELMEFQKENNPEFIRQMSKIPSYLPKDFKKIISCCLKYNPADRATIDDIYSSRIIQNYIKNGIKDFLNDYDSIKDKTLENSWEEILEECKKNEENQLIKKKDIIIYLLDHYKKAELMSEEEIMNMWQLIRSISNEIGYQLLLDPHLPDIVIKYYKTERHDDLRGNWEKTYYMTEIFPKMLEYLYIHKYNDEANAIIEALNKETISDDVRNNFINISEKYDY